MKPEYQIEASVFLEVQKNRIEDMGLPLELEDELKARIQYAMEFAAELYEGRRGPYRKTLEELFEKKEPKLVLIKGGVDLRA